MTVSVTGTGTVNASGTGISCSSQCSGAVPAGTSVTLTASAGSGYQFVGWGGACTGTGNCSVTLNQATTVTAQFAATTGTTSALTISKAGSGTVTSSPAGINCGTDCSEAYTNGTTVTLTAQAASGYTFSGWSGPCSGTGTCVVTMSQARTVSATFAGSTGAAGCTLTRGTATSPTFASSHPKVFLNHAATKSCLQTLLANGTSSATRFKSMVDSQLAGGNIYGFEPWYAALMYQVTGEQRYATYAIQQTDAFVASEEALINANQRATVAGDSYLEVGPIIGSLAVVYDWTYDLLTPAQRTRWINYANQAVWNVWNYQQAKWGNTTYAWSGWSIDNPSNNYYYSFLKATMLLGLATRGENAQAQAWIDKFRTEKIGNQLVPTFNRDLTGGGSREGTGYGTAMKGLWQLYDWWERSTGERIATLTPHTLASMAHLMHSIVPTLDRLAPTGDHARDSTAALFDYHREYLLELISLFPQERLSGAAKAELDASSVPRMTQYFEYFVDYLYEPPQLAATALTDLSTTYWGSGTGQLMMRSAWDTGAAFSNFICGPYTESHAHHDQGSFVLYRGNWLAYDANIDSASGIEQGEEMHNLVRITQGGSTVTQREGASQCNMLALADNAQFTYAVADVTPIYGGNAAVSKVQREFLFIRPSTFVVFDRVATASGTSRVWTLNVPGTATQSGSVVSYANGANRLDMHRIAPTGLTAAISSRRVEITDSAAGQSLFLNVLGTNGSVSSATAANGSGTTGVSISLADGRSATVRFSDSGTGGTLDLTAGAGLSAFSGALPTTVTAPPLFRN
ncbi:MAG: hypothetical protein E6Q93_06750 [Burkholderiaceae bacterium]|nr:MAG: hypothetical protein E6Q93_06750 [Burkholderiaceae bacterium]